MSQELLDIHKNNILNYIFNKEKIIKNFENNKEVILTDKWDLLLNYPNELYTLRRTTTTKSVILTRIVNSLLDKKDRIIHPMLLIIFYIELSEYIKYCEIDENEDEYNIQLLPKNKKILKEIKSQINFTFKIYWKLINDKIIKKFTYFYEENELVTEIINSLYYKITVEELIRLNQTYVETKKIRFNDLCINLDIDDKLHEKISPIKYIDFQKTRKKLNESQCQFQNKILIEINESHHEPMIDFLRKTSIYQTTGKVIIDYNIAIDEIENVYIKIMKEISKTIYKNYDEHLGIMFYLTTVENIHIKMADFFLEIKKSIDGFPIKKILNIFKNWGFVDKKNFMKIIKKELNNDIYFVKKDEYEIKNSLLSPNGIDRLIFLPRSDDFVNSEEILDFVEIYTKFRQGFFNTIESFLNNYEENNIIIYLVNKLSMREDFQHFKEPLITALLEKAMTPDIIDAVENKFNIKLDKRLPILIKSQSKYHNIELNIMKNTFGDKVADILEENFDTCKSIIEKRTFISKEIIDFIFNYSFN
jgi:hypothetical protein